MKLMSFLAFFFFLVGLVIAGYSIWSNPRSGRHRAMSVGGSLFALWSLTMVPVYGADSMEQALTWYKVSLPGILLLIPAIYWIYLDQAQFPAGWKWGLTAFVVASGAGFYGAYWMSGFLFSSFQPGPWGNIGTSAGSTVWYILASSFYSLTNLGMIVLMFWCRANASTVRLRRLYGANALGLIGSAVVFGVAVVLERNGWPPLDLVAAGFYLVGVNFYMAGRYGYLIRETVLTTPLVQDQVKDPLFVLEADGKVASVNLAAKRMLGEQMIRGAPFGLLFDSVPSMASLLETASRSQEPEYSAAVDHAGTKYSMTLAVQKDRFGDVRGAVVCLSPQLSAAKPDSGLGVSSREREILDLVVQGFANKTIADTLCLSEGTVKNYLYTLYRKLGVQSRLQLMNKMSKMPQDS